MTVGAFPFEVADDKSAVYAGLRLDISQGRTTSHTTAVTGFIRRIAIRTYVTLQALREGHPHAVLPGGEFNDLPDFFIELKRFDVLSQIVYPV